MFNAFLWWKSSYIYTGVFILHYLLKIRSNIIPIPLKTRPKHYFSWLIDISLCVSNVNRKMACQGETQAEKVVQKQAKGRQMTKVKRTKVVIRTADQEKVQPKLVVDKPWGRNIGEGRVCSRGLTPTAQHTVVAVFLGISRCAAESTLSHQIPSFLGLLIFQEPYGPSLQAGFYWHLFLSAWSTSHVCIY